MNKKQVLGGFIVAVLLALAMLVSGGSTPIKDQPAPDFTLTALDGSTVVLSELRGRPVLLSFWGSTCPPCRVEAPHLSRLAERYRGDGLVVLGVNSWNESEATVAKIAGDERLKHRILLYGGEAARRYKISSIPATFWIDREGMIVDAVYGFHGAEALEAKTRKLIDKTR